MCLHMRVWTQSFEIHLDRSRLSSLLWKKAGPDSDVSSQVLERQPTTKLAGAFS